MKRSITILLIIMLTFILIIPANAETYYDSLYRNSGIPDGNALLSKIVVSSVSQSTTDPRDTITVTVKLSNLNDTFLNDVMVSVGGLSAETLSLTKTFGPFEADFNSKDSNYVSFDLLAFPKITGGNYPLTLTLTYVDSYGDTVSVNRNISVLIDSVEEAVIPAPLVIVSSYAINKDQVIGGEEFELTFTVQNTSKDSSLNNLLLSFSSESNAFTPVSGTANQLYIDSIDAGGSYTVKLLLKANDTVETDFYNFNIDVQYQDPSQAPLKNTFFTSAKIGIQLGQVEIVEEAIPSMYITPHIVVSSYELSAEKIFGGEEFELTFTLLNTSSDLSLSNVMLSYSSAYSAFVPASGSSNQLYIGKISAGGSYTGTLKLKADNELKRGDYNLKLDMQFQDTYKSSYSTSADITLTLEQKQKLNLNMVSLAETCILGTQTLLSISYDNPGFADIKNVTLNLRGDIRENEKTMQIGTVKAGYSSFIDQYITPQSLGKQEIGITLSFEDDEGNKYKTGEKLVAITVKPQTITTGSDSIPLEDNPVENTALPDTTKGAFLNSIAAYFIIAGVILAAAAVFVIILMRKKKKAAWR